MMPVARQVASVILSEMNTSLVKRSHISFAVEGLENSAQQILLVRPANMYTFLSMNGVTVQPEEVEGKTRYRASNGLYVLEDRTFYVPSHLLASFGDDILKDYKPEYSTHLVRHTSGGMFAKIKHSGRVIMYSVGRNQSFARSLEIRESWRAEHDEMLSKRYKTDVIVLTIADEVVQVGRSSNNDPKVEKAQEVKGETS